jgi:hypothetical protein
MRKHLQFPTLLMIEHFLLCTKDQSLPSIIYNIKSLREKGDTWGSEQGNDQNLLYAYMKIS